MNFNIWNGDVVTQIVDEVHKQYPEFTCSTQQKDGSIIFFNKEGLPRAHLVIKQLGTEIQINLDLYENKLVESIDINFHKVEKDGNLSN